MWIKTNKKTLGLAFFNASGRKAAHLLPGDQDVTQTAGGGQSGCGKREANIDRLKGFQDSSPIWLPNSTLSKGHGHVGDPGWRVPGLNMEQRKQGGDTFSEKERSGSGESKHSHEC